MYICIYYIIIYILWKLPHSFVNLAGYQVSFNQDMFWVGTCWDPILQVLLPCVAQGLEVLKVAVDVVQIGAGLSTIETQIDSHILDVFVWAVSEVLLKFLDCYCKLLSISISLSPSPLSISISTSISLCIYLSIHPSSHIVIKQCQLEPDTYSLWQ